MSGLVLGVDVGGTFTDCVAYDPLENTLTVEKVPTTPNDQAAGLLVGLERLGVLQADVEVLVHGFTTGTNAVIERRGAVVGVIATRGFRDVLELRRRDRPHTWGLRETFTPLVPRYLRAEIDERVLADGTPVRAPERAEVERAARKLLAEGAEAVAISLLHSYAHPEHEQQVAEWVRELWPNPYVTASTEVMPEWREFERASAAVLNAFVQPIVHRYLGTLQERAREAGMQAPLLVVRSNGGLMRAADAARLPAFTLLSGPAAGVASAAATARAHNLPRVITYDMGGTSLDVSVVIDGRIQLRNARAIEFGLPLHVPQADITAIGAGGGSIAWIDGGGFLRVGPKSAGADPGPACYGRGGTEPTVTDAHVAVGTIDPRLTIGAGAGVSIDRDAALEALARLGSRLGLDALATAEAILEVANTKMVGALRAMSVQRGLDPRDFVLMPFGGAGPLHLCALIDLLGARGGIIPLTPGVMSAVGCAFADMQHELTRTLNRRLDGLGAGELADAVAVHTAEGEAFFGQPVTVHPSLAMNYVGQTHTIDVPVDAAWGRDELAAAFERVYETRFGRTLPRLPINIESVRSSLVSPRSFEGSPTVASDHVEVPSPERTIRHRGADVSARILRRSEVAGEVAGPAVIVQSDATIFIEPGFSCRSLGTSLNVERVP
jgi:N-methylhydantoinase A